MLCVFSETLQSLAETLLVRLDLFDALQVALAKLF